MSEYIIDDEILAYNAQKGDRESAESLLRKYKGLVVKCTRSYFIIGAEQDDLIQEGMIGLYKAVLSYKSGNAKFMTYAYSCIKTSILDAIKSAGRDKHKPLNNYESLANDSTHDNIDKINDIDTVIRLAEVDELLRDVKKILSKKEKAVFDLYIEGFTINEIATKVGNTPKSVENAVSRIKNKVARLL